MRDMNAREYVQLENEEWLRKEYLEKDKTMKEIASEIDCHWGTVQSWIHEHNIPTRETKPFLERFWDRVDKRENGCWEWTGGVTKRGYGTIGLKNRKYKAHRLSYKIHFDEDISELQINHHCDNRICVNPDHIYAGSHQDNMDDATERNRFPKGSDHTNAKLNECQVKEIKMKYEPYVTSQNDLAEMYDVSSTTIQEIIEGKRWEHVEP